RPHTAAARAAQKRRPPPRRDAARPNRARARAPRRRVRRLSPGRPAAAASARRPAGFLQPLAFQRGAPDRTQAPTSMATAAAPDTGLRARPPPAGTAGKPAAAAAAPPGARRAPPRQHPLRIDSTFAFWALVVLPLLVWWGCVGGGVWNYEGLPPGKKRVTHLMVWFDDLIVRPAGPALPFAILAARAAVGAAADWRGGGRGGRPRRLATLALSCLGVYVTVAAARAVLYYAHYSSLKAKLLTFHLVSDHLFLGAAILTCLHSEAICLLSDARRAAAASGGRVSGREVGLSVAMVGALVLAGLTAADMYYTAKHFHHPVESLATAVAAFALFQAPVMLWLSRCRQGGGGGVAAAARGAAPAAARA
ncbi:MAG: hypothetical protein J3K34DRAFT_493343, partial [Monoraphidium minutum]